ncbi:MAG: hypothetical protein JNN05_02770 [Candidatus Omnitrophica bacterium]|nr:hypothetical protein [Candidatus Omnitrophota bacterium]
MLVDPLDVSQVANAIESILSNSELRKNLADKGLEYVKEYSAENISRRIYDFFLEQYKLSVSKS